MDGWSFGVLGDLTVVRDELEVAVRGQRRRALLVRLLIARGAPVSSEVLIDDVWNHVARPRAASTLQSHVSLLRRELGDRLQRTAGGYRLAVADDEFDVTCSRPTHDPGNRRCMQGTLTWRSTRSGGRCRDGGAGRWLTSPRLVGQPVTSPDWASCGRRCWRVGSKPDHWPAAMPG